MTGVRPTPEGQREVHLLEAAHVTKRFAGVPVLKGVDFLLERGQVHGLAGVDGAGKSTLVKVLTGVYQPDRGLLFHKGEPVRFKGAGDAQQRGICTIHQDTRPAGSMSVGASLFEGRRVPRRFGFRCPRHMHQAASSLLESLGILVDPRQELRSLSPAVQKMVAIARAVHTEARVVIMDEPASTLEPSDMDTLFDVIRGLHERDVAVVYVSHQLDELYQICNRITVLRDGESVHSGLMSGISPTGLVGAMLGREPDAVCRESLAAFTGKHEAARSSVLKAEQFFKRAHE